MCILLQLKDIFQIQGNGEIFQLFEITVWLPSIAIVHDSAQMHAWIINTIFG